MDMQPAWVTPGGLFVVLLDGREVYINFARSPLNSDTSVSLAKDKYYTRLILERNGIANIPFAQPVTYAQAEAFLLTHRRIIAKPVRGSGASDIHIISTAEQLQQLAIEEYILEKYIIGKEMRYLVLNGTVLGVYWSDYGFSVAANRDLRCISFDRADWDDALVDSSVRVASALGLSFAAVDYLVDDEGKAHVLEVNAMPDLKWFHAPSLGPAVDVAGAFLQSLVAPKVATPKSWAPMGVR